MTPVISPWVFYFISVVDSLVSLATIVLMLGGVIFIVGLLFVLIAGYDEDDDEVIHVKKFIKKLVPYLVIAGMVLGFTPNSYTITKMIVAKNVTYERVEVVEDTVETVYNDIMELFENREG